MRTDIATIAIVIPQGVDFKLGARINVQGHDVECITIAWESNSIRQASALEQRLEVALDLLEHGDYLEKDLSGYNYRLEELRETNDLIELEE